MITHARNSHFNLNLQGCINRTLQMGKLWTSCHVNKVWLTRRWTNNLFHGLVVNVMPENMILAIKYLFIALHKTSKQVYKDSVLPPLNTNYYFTDGFSMCNTGLSTFLCFKFFYYARTPCSGLWYCFIL